ncbi:MAG: hypothetical protein ACLUIS_02350 [Longibaculum sp.]
MIKNQKKINVSFVSLNVQNIEKYISNLKTKQQMNNITYSGYQQSKGSNSVGTGEYNVLTGEEITTITESTHYSFSLIISLDGGEQ